MSRNVAITVKCWKATPHKNTLDSPESTYFPPPSVSLSFPHIPSQFSQFIIFELIDYKKRILSRPTRVQTCYICITVDQKPDVTGNVTRQETDGSCIVTTGVTIFDSVGSMSVSLAYVFMWQQRRILWCYMWHLSEAVSPGNVNKLFKESVKGVRCMPFYYSASNETQDVFFTSRKLILI